MTSVHTSKKRRMIDIKRSYKRTSYDEESIAKYYEKERLLTSFRKYKHYLEVLFVLSFLENGKVLDVGSGTGRITKILIRRGIDVTPVDLALAMLNVLKQSCNVTPILADATALPFRDNTFENVISIRVIWHLNSEKKVLDMISELARVSSKCVIMDVMCKERNDNPLWKLIVRIYYKLIHSNVKEKEDESYIPSFKELSEMFKANKLKIVEREPLIVIPWLIVNLLPSTLIDFTVLFHLDKIFSKVVPPERYMLKMVKTECA